MVVAVTSSGPVIVVHQPTVPVRVEDEASVRLVTRSTVCGLPWAEPDLSHPYPRVACRGCLAPERPLPAHKVAVDRQDLEEAIKALQTVSRRLGIPPKLLERLTEAWERKA